MLETMESKTPTVICILGGGGDLAKKKLFPALFELFTHKKMPVAFRVIGFARTSRSDTEYRIFVQEALTVALPEATTESITAFCEHIFYSTGTLSLKSSYTQLETHIDNFESMVGTKVNRLLYLAIPPSEYESTFTQLHASGIASTDASHSHFARILVEKPFGNDFKSAQKLDTFLSSLFREDQIFRIDHYLAKDAVQNILSFRFANTLLQSAWNCASIKEVHITLEEKVDVGTRGTFYDTVGALRDVGQNHLLQILALIAMDEPAQLSADTIRSKRAELITKLIPFTKEHAQTDIVRAQYNGYLETVGVQNNTSTETYFALKTYIDSDRWNGVPFYIKAGKALHREKVAVQIFFHDVATGPFETSSCATVGNVIELEISPLQAMHITLNVKKPGRKYQVESNTLSHTWDAQYYGSMNAYEKVLLDCIDGDQTVFASSDEVLASWKFITSVLEVWDTVPLQAYAKGSAGPENTLK